MATDDDVADGARSGEAGERSRQPCGRRKGEKMAKKETRTLSLVLIDPKGKTVSYSIRNPKADLNKEAVDNAVKAVIDGKIFATANGDLMALKSSQVVTRQVETLE
jgi:hypothetical protein